MGPFRLLSTIEELLERKSSGSGLENREYGREDLLCDTSLSAKVGTNFVDKRYSSLADSGHGVYFSLFDPSPLGKEAQLKSM
jgi:hypothetical protein